MAQTRGVKKKKGETGNKREPRKEKRNLREGQGAGSGSLERIQGKRKKRQEGERIKNKITTSRKRKNKFSFKKRNLRFRNNFKVIYLITHK